MKKSRVMFRNEQDKEPMLPATCALVRGVVDTTREFMELAYPISVSVTFTDDDKIREINRDFRGIDAPTDVLSFPQYDPDELYGGALSSGEPVLLGDIVLSLERARAQSIEYGHSYVREVAFLCAHSMLHLLGYDHIEKEDELEMRRLQDEILEIMGISRKVCHSEETKR